MLKHEIAVRLPNQEGNLPIHIAAELGLDRYVKELFAHNLLDAKNSNNYTPLHLASHHGKKSVVTYLVDNSPQSINSLAKFKHGNSLFTVSPLALAVIGCSLAICAFAPVWAPSILTTTKTVGSAVKAGIVLNKGKLLFFTLVGGASAVVGYFGYELKKEKMAIYTTSPN